jgi:rhodanese-related sulfurtransferase/DNA-directed RNA polymerase subunit RPC12/RpoP
MKIFSKIIALPLFFALICNFSGSAQKVPTSLIQYVCSPCGQLCDKEIYSAPGVCAKCKMKLVDKKTIVHKSISPSGLSKFIKSNPKLLIIDVRTKEEYDGKAEPNFGTIKNAVNIPISEMEKGAYSKLDKNKTILVYCSHSHRSSVVSYTLTQNGFKNIVNLSGGMSVVTDKSILK